MGRQTQTGMRLRGNIQRPVRYEEDPDVHLRKPYERKNGSKPAFPELLEQQVIPFNPNNPPAAFPSLPLTQQSHLQRETQEQSSLQAFHENENVNSPAPKIDTALDISRLGCETYGFDDDNIVDFPMSNNIAAGNIQGAQAPHTASDPVLEDVIEWSSLELTYKYRIFRTLCKSSGDNNAVLWLGLTESEVDAIKKAVAWREKYPLTLTQSNAGQNSHPKWLEPSLLTKHSDFLIQISQYELGSPLELLRAGMFLQQIKMPLDLLGKWEQDPLGSGQLVESTPLTQLFPAGNLTSKQLHHVQLRGTGGLRLALPDGRAPGPVTEPQRARPCAHHADAPRSILRLKYATKRGGGRPVGRPRKGPPVSLEEQSTTVQLPHPAMENNEVALDTPDKRSTRDVSSGNTSSSSEDFVSMMNRWTQPVTKGVVQAENDIVKAHHGSMVERATVSKTMKLPQDLEQADTVANSQQDRDLTMDTAPNTPSTRSPTQASTASSGSRTPRLKLKISNTGIASVISDAPVASLPSYSTESGKSVSNFAGTPSVHGHTSKSISSVPPWSTPKPLHIKIEKPRRAEDDFKQSTRSIHVSVGSPTRFGDANDFPTRLVIPRDHRPRTPDPDDLGVFASTENVQDPSGLVAHQSHVPRDDCGTTVAGSSQPVTGAPNIDDVVPSIERDINMVDAPFLSLQTSNTAIEFTPIVNAFATSPLSTGHLQDRRSPSPPRSISPISDNEDFEEYHAWLRGETTRGPMPQKASLTLKLPDYVPADAIQANTTPVQQSDASAQVASNVLRLKIGVTNEALQTGLYSQVEGLTFKDPGENGDGDWEDSAPKQKEKTLKKVSSKKTTPQQKQPQKTPKSALATTKTAVKASPMTPKASKRKTKAQSLATDETPVIHETRSRTATPISDLELRISISKQQDVVRDRQPRRSARLSSAEVTEESDGARVTARNKKFETPLRAKLTPVSRLRQSMTPSSNAREGSTSGRATIPAIGQSEAIMIDSASEVDSDATSASSWTGKQRKKWTHKEYKKTRVSSRLSEMELPSMKV